MQRGSDDALLREIVEGPRRTLVRLPDMRRIERPGWFQIITPSFRQGGFNEVECSELSEAEADAVIDATVGEYRRLGVRFRWLLRPVTQPADLGARLARRGLVPSISCAMFSETASPEVPFPAEEAATAADVTVEEIDEVGLDAYVRAMAIGWNVEEGPLSKAYRLIMSAPDRKDRLFIARYRGQAAAVAGYADLGRSAHLLGGVALPEFRRLGSYRALVASRLRDARARGITLATTLAIESTSAPILERMGFRALCRLTTYSG